MLINCPRCGFSQPNDQYCAQCGVDMASYKPKSEPLYVKIFQSPTTHVVILLLLAVLVGQYIIRNDQPQKWVQKLTHSQAVSKSKAKFETKNEENVLSENKNSAGLGSIKNEELEIPAATEQPIQAGNLIKSTESSGDISLPTFRTIYAEVPVETLSKWIFESSQLGLYQNLQDYSAGLLTDFRKKTSDRFQTLKVTEKKLSIGQTDSQFLGLNHEDINQQVGLSTSIEFKSNENGVIHGSVVVDRHQRQIRDHFPAEFELPKYSVFFIVGALKRQNFLNDKNILSMEPFQIFKSNDFMTQKTEFVIIVEPDYK